MQFANADMFWLFLSAVFVYTVGRWALRAQEKQLAAFADAQLASRLLAGFESVVARKRQTVLLASLATLCFAAVLLRPQWGFTWKEASRRGLDIMIALDTSSSMLAEDVKPNRLVRAQREVADLLRHLRGDRIGLVLFAGTSFLEVPLTLDYGLFRLFLSSVSTEAIPVPGTNVEDAIIEGVRGLDRGSRPDTAIFSRPKRDRALILITDGEDFEGNMDRAARTAKDANVLIYIVGVGTAEGAPIPLPSGYKQDRRGSVVISKLNEDKLKQLAAQTGGTYVRSITGDDDIAAIYDFGMRQTLDSSTLKWGRGKRWNEHFQLPLFLGLLLLLAGPWASFRAPNSSSFAPSHGSKKKTPLALSLMAAFILAQDPVAAHAEPAEALGAKAKEAYEKADFETALHAFSAGAEKQQHDYRFAAGKGASYYRLGAFPQAKESFLHASTLSGNNEQKAQALYNAANSMVQLGEFEEAIKTYEQSLALAADDDDAKVNLAIAKELLKRRQETPRDQAQDQNPAQPQQNGGAGADQQPPSGSNETQMQPQEPNQSPADPRNSVARLPEDAEKQQSSSGEPSNKQHTPFDQNQALLDSIEEDPAARAAYRKLKGLQQLEAQKKKPPERDW